MDTLETFRVYRATIPLSFLQILNLYTVSSRFYESLNEENWMCELCTFSQIRSQLVIYVDTVRCLVVYATLLYLVIISF